MDIVPTRTLLRRCLVAIPFLVTSTVLHAGIGLGIAPTYPEAVQVGDTNVPVSLSITNTSTSPQDVGEIELTKIVHHPSCQDFSAPCASPENAIVVPTLSFLISRGL